MNLRRTWFLLAGLLLVGGLGGCGEPAPYQGATPTAQAPAVQETITEEQAIAAIKKLGGSVHFNDNNAVVGVNLGGTKVTDAGLKELAGLTQLQTLGLWSTQVTDAGLKELAGLTQMQGLYLIQTQVTDAGLKELARLTQLRSLDLRDTQVTDAGLKELAGLTELNTLDLTGAKVTDAGVQELKKALPKVEINR